LSFSSYLHPCVIHPFPTRRSSDLAAPQSRLLAMINEGAEIDAISHVDRDGATLLRMSLAADDPDRKQAEDENIDELADRMRDDRSEEHRSELQSRVDLVCRLLLEK